jgi:hypothetical protein
MEIIILINQYRSIVNQEMEKENPDHRIILFYECMIRSLKEDYSTIYCMEN